MASSPPPSSSPRNWTHHVFPSFYGADVRKTFLSHVLEKFKSKGINPFIDNDIVIGNSIGPDIIQAIRGSRIAMVFLSKNYASSTWCLDELVEIMKCRVELGLTVMTLLYEVDPSDVKKLTGDFGKVFGKTCKGKTRDNIERWRHALTEVVRVAGYHSNNWDNEAEMIEKIAIDVSNVLNISAPSSDFDGFVGMESHMIKMGSLLRLDSEEVRMIGIWGPSGIGKTHIARFLFNRHFKDFQLSVFMENIKTRYKIPASSDDYGEKKYLQKEFLSQIINHEGINIPHLGIVKDRLKDKKVLVVLDDVDQLVQLEAMAKETGWFGPWSRIIVTTQDRKILRAHGINHIYKVDFPSSHQALEMFCMYAFDQKSPKDGFKELALEVTTLVGALPLGLKVMGSFFRGMSKQEWTMGLPRVKKHLDGDIESILKLSYDALCDEDKKLFLHIACSFNGDSVDRVEHYLADSVSNVTQGLHNLAEKSLISMDGGMIEMHVLLVRLGKEIMRKQPVREPRVKSKSRCFSGMAFLFIINFLMEIASAVADQLSSIRKPHFARISLVMSVLSVLFSIFDLAYKVRAHKACFRCKWPIPWFYYPSRGYNRIFGSFTETVLLFCGVGQLILSTINYSFIQNQRDGPINVSVWPLLFAFAMVISKFMEKPTISKES